MNSTIGVLRHSENGHAEERILAAGKEMGLEILIIDPFSITMGISPSLFQSRGRTINLEGIISRCDIGSPPGAEFETYLRALDFFESIGIPAINAARSIISSQDKFRTHLTLAQHGIPTPKTFVVCQFNTGINLLAEGKLNFPFIVKKVYGSHGTGVFKVHSIRELELLYANQFEAGEALFFQEFLELERNRKGEIRDYRVWVVRDPLTGQPRTIGAVFRNAKAGEFRTNVRQGGYVTGVKELPAEVSQLAERSLDAVSGDVAGIDVAQTRDGRFFVEEVNISFETGNHSEKLIGNIWAEVLRLLVSRIETNFKTEALQVPGFQETPYVHAVGI